MKQITTNKFTGLQVLQNSLTVAPGAFERIDNAVLSQDYIVSKNRGSNLNSQFQTSQIINALFDYGLSRFSISQDTLYREFTSPVTAQANSASGTTIITVRKASHGIRNSDYISGFVAVDTDALVAAFPRRQADFYGTRQITTRFTASASRTAGVTFVTFTNQGMQAGDRVNVISSTLTPAVPTGTNTITGVSTNVFSFLDAGANSSGSITFEMLDSFRISADENATATVNSAANAVQYTYYIVQTGQTVSVTDAGVGVSRIVKASKNAYFTTDNGLLKLEREDLPILKAGIPPGLDLQGILSGVTGPIGANTEVGYRILFGRKDANSNTVLGAPSEFLILRNTRVTSATASFSKGPPDVITVTSTAHGLSTGNIVYLYDVVSTGGTIPDGTAFTITVTGVNSFTIRTDNQGFPALTNVTALNYGVKKSAKLTFTIPSEILSTQYIYQIYRSSQSINDATTPSADYKLVQEANLTSAQITQGFVDFTDLVDDTLISTNQQLYTNPTQEGEQQANSRPPRANDVALFKNYVFYANIIQYRILNFNVVAPSSLTSGDYITVGTQSYIFRGNATNDAVGNERRLADAAARVTNVTTVTKTAHGFLTGDTINVISSTLTPGTPPGTKTITGVTANTFTFADTAADSAGTIEYEGLADTAGKRLVKLVQAIPSPLVTLSESIQSTSKYLVKAFDRNPNSNVYAQYASSVTDSPGKIFLIAKDVNAVTFAATASSSAAGNAFVPTFPTSGTTVSDTQDLGPNQILVSKLDEPEAVPLFNSFLVSSGSSAILRIEALRDSLIIIKEDGVFRLNGDAISNFTVTALDNTVLCRAADSVVVLNNSVYMFSNQGVVQITDTSVRIASRSIEPFLTAVIGKSDIADFTSAVAYESERLYLLATLSPNSNSTIADVVYCYNYLTESWTTWSREDIIFSQGYVSGFDDKLYVIRADGNNLQTKERKDQTKIDFTGQEYCVPVIVAVPANATALVGLPGVTVTSQIAHKLAVGDVVTITRTNAALAAGFAGGASDVNGLRVVTSITTDYVFTFAAATNATVNISGGLYYEQGISETNVSTSVVAGSKTAVVTTAVPHNLTSTSLITVHSLSSAIAAAFTNATDITGTRAITVLTPTTFQFQTTNSALSTVTNTILISDKTQDRLHVTLQVPSTLKIQVGDGILANNNLYKIYAYYIYSSTAVIAELLSDYDGLSTDLAFINTGYATTLRMTPLTAGNIAITKSFSEFQSSFRNYSSCSQISVGFACDSVNSSTPQMWDVRVGTLQQDINFVGWGDFEWGEFPWGGEVSINRDYITRPAVIMRMYIPIEASIGTFVQPLFTHYTAGEPLELQSVSLYLQPESQRTSR